MNALTDVLTSCNDSYMDTNEARLIGRNAHFAGDPAVPFANADICAAIDHLPVGGGAAPLMKAFLAGWHEANLAAAVA